MDSGLLAVLTSDGGAGERGSGVGKNGLTDTWWSGKRFGGKGIEDMWAIFKDVVFKLRDEETPVRSEGSNAVNPAG